MSQNNEIVMHQMCFSGSMCAKTRFGRGSTPDLTGAGYNAPHNP